MTVAILTLLSVASAAFASSVGRRADAAPAPAPTRFTIPLKTNAQKYTARIGMGKNDSTIQQFNFAFSTTLGYTLVAGGNCQSCLQSSSGSGYNLTSGATVLNDTGTAAVGGGTASGPRIRENCFLRTDTDTWWPYPNQTIVVANQTSESFLTGNISGIVGLGTKGTTDGSDTFIAGLFRSRPQWTNVTIGMALKPTVRSADGDTGLANAVGDGGEMHIAIPNPGFISGPVSSQVVQGIGDADVPPGMASGDWAIQFDSWKFTGDFNVDSPKSGLAIIEPFTLGIFVPRDDAKAIYGSVKGSAQKNTSASAIGVSYTVPCSSKMTFTVTFGAVTIPLDQNDLITNTGKECTGVIQGWANDSSIYVLGSAFASKSYLIFTAQKSSNEPNTIGVALRSVSVPADSASIGAIVGGVVGGVAVIAIFIFLCWWFFIRQPKRKPERISVGMVRGGHGSSTLTEGNSTLKKRRAPTQEKELMIIEPFQFTPEPESPAPARANTGSAPITASSHAQRESYLEHQQLIPSHSDHHQSLYFTDPGSPISEVGSPPVHPTYTGVLGGLSLPRDDAYGSALGSSDISRDHGTPSPNQPIFYVTERNPGNRIPG